MGLYQHCIILEFKLCNKWIKCDNENILLTKISYY